MLVRPDRRATVRARRRLATAQCRERVKKHQALAKVTIDGAIIGMLIRTGWLSEAEATNNKSIGRALTEMLRDAAHAENM
jgi:hypothetical protein